MKTIKLFNKGTFNFSNLLRRDQNPKATSGKCGWPNKSIFDYEVELCGDETILNREKAFILDVDAIDQYFTDRYVNNKKKVTMSCEQIAIKARDEIMGLVELKECLISCKVKISPTKYSHFEAQWEKNQMKPVFTFSPIKRPAKRLYVPKTAS